MILVVTPLRDRYSSKINLVFALKFFFDRKISGHTINGVRLLCSRSTVKEVPNDYIKLGVLYILQARLLHILSVNVRLLHKKLITYPIKLTEFLLNAKYYLHFSIAYDHLIMKILP